MQQAKLNIIMQMMVMFFQGLLANCIMNETCRYFNNDYLIIIPMEIRKQNNNHLLSENDAINIFMDRFIYVRFDPLIVNVNKLTHYNNLYYNIFIG